MQIITATNKFCYTEGAVKFSVLSGNRKRTAIRKKKTFCWVWESASKDTVSCHVDILTSTVQSKACKALASTPSPQLLVSPRVERRYIEEHRQRRANASFASHSNASLKLRIMRPPVPNAWVRQCTWSHNNLSSPNLCTHYRLAPRWGMGAA